MTNAPKHLLTATALAALLIAGGPLQRAAHAGTVDKTCYWAADYDVDGDGFADWDAVGHIEHVDEHKKLYCPEGSVSEAGDCDDTRASVHPYAPEIAFNGVNDDCSDSGKDEPELVYFPNGNQNTATGFKIRVRLASSYLVSFGSRLAYEVEFADLAAADFEGFTPKRSVGVLPSDYAFDAPVTGLQPARVYRARLRFYEASSTTVLVRGVPSRRTTYADLHRESEWYYSATQGSGLLEEARTDLLLDGFYQLSESDRGRIGYLGTAKRDGTRFGAASRERWCSEFYTWLASAQFWQIGAYTNTGGIMWWFMTTASYHTGASAIPEVAERADYIPHDAANDGDHEADHSTMFLAYEPARNIVWTLEGNKGNHVVVHDSTLGTGQLGVGHLTLGSLILMNLF